MNQIQEAIARVTGVDEEINELRLALESTNSVNALLARQIEDIDYLNLFDINDITDVLTTDRKATIKRLRRLRQENPNAKQTVLLILRFTLGKGVELLIGPDPTKPNELLPPEAQDQKPGDGGPKVNGLFPGNRPNAVVPLLPRPRPQVGEQVQTDDETQGILHTFWQDDDNKLAFTHRQAMREFLDGVITDGEKFMLGYTGSAEPYVKLSELPLEEIDNIIYDPDNRVRPVYYHRVFNKKIFKDGMYQPDLNGAKELYYLDWRITQEDLDGTDEEPGLLKNIKIPAKKLAPIEQRVFHAYINPLWTKKGKRGISEIYASREWFRVHKEFMEDRAAINAAATAISYKRKVKGGPTEVSKLSGTLGGRSVGVDSAAAENDSPVRKLNRPSPGSIHDSNPAVDLEWMKTDTGAQGAKEDGRALLQTAGVGAGIFVHYYGDGGDATLATAQAMELPMVKTFEDWQQWVEDVIKDLCYWVLCVATDDKNATSQLPRVAGAFPPIVSQDVVKYMTAWSQLVQNVAPGNKIVHKAAIKGALQVMNVPNIDALMQEVEAEEVQLEAERQARQQAMLDSLNSPPPSPFSNGNGGKASARDGSGQALPPDLKTVAKGKPAPERNGPKPA